MNEPNPLQRYLASGSSEDFGALVRQHADLVYSAARRQLSDSHLAEDVTQAVFLLLHQKARRIKPGTLAGWLVQATYYACRDARKMAQRRQRYERRAALMQPQATTQATAPEWEKYAPVLDAALLRLSTLDREAIALRYLKGQPLRQVGESLGLTEEAARKRVDRALVKLRGLLCAETHTPLPASSLLGATLLAHALQTAPGHLLTTLIAGGGSAVAGAVGVGTAGAAGSGTSITLLAKGVSHAMLLVKLKLAAAIMVAVLVATVGTAVLIHRAENPRPKAADPLPPIPAVESIKAPDSPTTLATATSNPDEVEASLPGEIQLALWDVILDAQGAETIKKVLAPIETPSKVYQAMTGNGVALRRAVRQTMTDGTFIRGSGAMEVFYSSEGKDKSIPLEPNTNFEYFSKHNDYVRISGNLDLTNSAFTRLTDNQLQLTLQCPNLNIDVSELTDRRQPAGLKGQAMMYQGKLDAGHAVAFLGELVGNSGTPYYHLVVYETYKAVPQNVWFLYQQRDSTWWCQYGPARMRLWANTLRSWKAQATYENEKTPPEMEVTLEDGKNLRFIGMCRHDQWPLCWWNSAGNPIYTNTGQRFFGEPRGGLNAQVFVQSEYDDEYKRNSPNGHQPYSEMNGSHSGTLSNESSTVNVGVLVGPWKEITRLQINQPVTVNGIPYLISNPHSRDDATCYVDFRGAEEPTDFQECLTAVARDGTETEPDSSHRPDQVLFEPPLPRRPTHFLEIKLEEIAYFRVTQRKRQWVTFQNCATNPKMIPQALASEEDIVRAERARILQIEHAKHKAWAAIVPNTTHYLGLARMLVDAVKARNEKLAIHLLNATEQNTPQDLELIVRYLIAVDTLRTLAITRYGETAIMESISSQFAPLPDIEELLINGIFPSYLWRKQRNGSYYNGYLEIAQNSKGDYYISKIYLYGTDPANKVKLRNELPKFLALTDLLKQNPKLTLEQFIAAVTVPVPAATEPSNQPATKLGT